MYYQGKKAEIEKRLHLEKFDHLKEVFKKVFDLAEKEYNIPIRKNSKTE